jgi:glutamine amidotransferase
MCRHLAYLGPPRPLASFLYEAPFSLEVQTTQPRMQRHGVENIDGWGVGWWDPAVRPEPARYRTALPMSSDSGFRSVAEVVHTTALVAAARNASPGFPIVATGNAPFTVGRWLFSLNGFVDTYRDGLGERLRRAASPERAAGITGVSDTEVLFALVLDLLDQGASAADALASVVDRVLRAAPGSYLNLLLGDGSSIVATAGGNSLAVLRGGTLAPDGVVVASEPLDDDPGWEIVPDRSVVIATAAEHQIAPLATFGGPS